MSGNRLQPATLSLADGIPYSDAYGDVYHSADGGPAQARHVFLAGNGLPGRWRGRERFTVIETGFGLGLNFLATWQAWREDPSHSGQLHYVAIEKHPFTTQDLERLHALWPELAPFSAALRDAWPVLVAGFHRVELDEGRVVLTLAFGDIADCLPQIDAAADAFYLDGFAPGKNPDMWAPEVLARIGRLAAVEATAATYTIAASVMKALAQAGFVCEKRPGFGRKPEMLAARYSPRWPVPARPVVTDRRAIVIGAGVAGSSACERLAARGWQVTLIERHDGPAQEASGNLAGIAMPLLSRDDNISSRLLRTAFLYTVRRWERLGGIGKAFAGDACGVLHLARDAEHARVQRETVESLGLPPGFVRWLGPAAVTEMTGNTESHGAWLYPQGGWLTPSSLCAALLDACGSRLQRRFVQEAVAIEHEGEAWSVRGAGGELLAQAPVVILANGTNATSFPQTQALPLEAIRGQVTHVPADTLPPLNIVLCGEGYVAGPANGICCVGASYDFDSETQLRQSSQDGNMERLAQLLPQASVRIGLAGRVGFRCVSPDRLPLAGALPDASAPIGGSRLRDVPRLPGLYGLLAYGSRGMVWAPFAAELLASSLEGEPLPIERELAEALDPARFALKAYRRGGVHAATGQHAQDL